MWCKDCSVVIAFLKYPMLISTVHDDKAHIKDDEGDMIEEIPGF